MECAILRALIQWGLTESASDICRSLEEHFGAALESCLDGDSLRSIHLSAQDRGFVRDLLRDAYLRTREIPRRGIAQARLHEGLLTGFEELARQIIRSYEELLLKPERVARGERAA